MIGALLIFIDLVIKSHISLELANKVWPKLETCVISQCFGCPAALISFSHCLLVCIRKVKRCDHDQVRNIEIPYLEMDKNHCT